ncbi:MAG: metalloregulator ArsR/SmtB family transcription factor [Selenomonadaceae bacterium]|nr:metalloregulator ArsR/SmtB family transcription factor [Selenomonadaceae bacterium]
MTYRKEIRLFKALADANRLQILESLQNGEKCACILLEELNIAQPTLSHHMKILVDAELVNFRKEGKWMHYSLREDIKNHVIGRLEKFIK